MPSEGQALALDQLRRIANFEGSALRIDHVEEKTAPNETLKVDVSIDCSHYESGAGGLALHARESVRLHVYADFPYDIPTVTTAHTRFLGFPHVQWGVQLCLYQSAEAQWQPSRGMVGLIEQLDEWFRKAAVNELDDPEGPLHPPVAYRVADTTICMQADTPRRDRWPWFGAAVLQRRKPGLLEVTSWEDVAAIPLDQPFAPTVLLDSELPFEYPRTLRWLLKCMEKRGVETTRVLVHLMLASQRLGVDEPLYVVIGAPSRGTAGDKDTRSQHLQAWEIEPADVSKLRAAATACDILDRFKGQETSPELRALTDDVFDTLFQWQRESQVRWCSIMENRPEIVIRRDEGTATDWFRGKTVVLWGCGALGGQVAEHLVRAGVKELVLYDHKKVHVGVLVRQNFVDADINEAKAAALKGRLETIAPGITITAITGDILRDALRDDRWQDDPDIVIDTTASLRVRTKLEAVLKQSRSRVPVAALMVSGAARHAAVVLAPTAFTGGPLDVLRRLGLAAMNRAWLTQWVKAFWSAETDEPTRQPEPGCSDPTFVGSHADLAGLAARMLNRLAVELAAGRDEAMGCLLAQDALVQPDYVFHFKLDIVIDGDGLQFRLSADAWRDIRGWMHAGARERSPEDETGGLLFGQFNEVLGIGWISNASGPPADSTFAPSGFVCGTDGTKELARQYERRSYGVIQYVGTWHSHPISEARPSGTDLAGIGSIFAASPGEGVHQLMMIVGNAMRSRPELGLYAFEREQLTIRENRLSLAMNMRGGRAEAPPSTAIGKTIGLALSGGGSRAVAFHLGTLRALEDLGLLDEVKIVSGVSGGSVVTGILGYSSERFTEIDQTIVNFLRHGLAWTALKKLIHPRRLLSLTSAFVVVTMPTLIVGPLRASLARLATLLPGSTRLHALLSRLRWPIRRWYSRSHVMADAIADVVGMQRCDAPTRQGMSVVFNACELRTGTAFRMSNERFGSWRYGWAPAGHLRIADAITASGAYPPYLPGFDWSVSFSNGAQERRARVIVTDGGVFDNLGVSVMEPGRDSSVSVVSCAPEVIIASDASAGQFSGQGLPTSWPARMTQVFSAVMRKVQDATKQRLHQYAAEGHIDRFLYIHLGQRDDRVPLKPANWIARSIVNEYPTDFSAMPDETIRRISSRGEALTRALASQYLLSD